MKIDWPLIFLIIVIIHAIGHLMPGFIHTFGLVKLGFMPSNESWLLDTKLNLNHSITKLVSTLFLMESVVFFVVSWMIHTDTANWEFLAVPFGILSLFLFVAWFTSFPPNIPVAAIIGNLIIFWEVIN